MQDVRITESYKGGSVAAECLSAFIFGLIAAQILNVVTLYIPFQLGAWVVNPNNYPGLTASILFCIMGLALRLFLVVSDDENETYRHPTISTTTTLPSTKRCLKHGEHERSSFACFRSC